MDLREQILEADDIREEVIEVPEWPDPETKEPASILIRELSGKERARLIDKDGNISFATGYAKMIIASCYDPETSKPIFTDADRAALEGKSSSALDRIIFASARLSGLDAPTKDTPGTAGEAGKDLD